MTSAAIRQFNDPNVVVANLRAGPDAPTVLDSAYESRWRKLYGNSRRGG